MSDGKKFYWIKLRKDFFKRHDIRIIEGMEDGKEISLFYLKLMLESVDHDGELRFSEDIPYTPEMLAVITDTDKDIVDKALKTLSMFKLVIIDDDKTIKLPKVPSMVGFETEWAKKKREYRTSQGQSEDNVRTMSEDKKDNVRQEIEKELEKEIEIEIETELERESKERKTPPHFMPPTVEEVYLYCEQRHNGIDAQRFVDYYTAKGWKNITDWKAQIRVWESRKEITE